MTQPSLLDIPHLAEIARTRAELAPALYTRVAASNSLRASWESLHQAGVFTEPVGRFYASVRRYGLEATLDGLFSADRLDAIRAYVTSPQEVQPPRVSVSTLSNQFYCEMQVHLARTHSLRTESAELSAGTAGHAVFEAEAVEISQEEIDKALSSGEALELVEMPLSAVLHGVKLVGRADRIHLEGRRARLVLEFKFSGRRELFPSHVVQVEAYGRMLEANNFDTEGMLYAVAVLPRGRKITDGLASEIAERALQADLRTNDSDVETNTISMPDPLEGLQFRRIDDEAFGMWVFRHHSQRAERDLSWALRYWSGVRSPEGTRSRGKCRACPFNAANLCDVSMAPPDGRYAVKRTEGRYGVLHVVQPSIEPTSGAGEIKK
jgi:hypothetical protein